MIAETDFFLGGEGRPKPANAAAAIIVVDSTQYLMQLRDQMPNIFYPGHWGLFGGAIEHGEDPEAALRRELMEELTLPASGFRYLTRFSFDYGRFGVVDRAFYEVHITSSSLNGLTLHEGAGMRAFAAAELLRLPRLVPYDSFAVWLHASGALAL
jgi:8-oxo-dGTP pyrophosphatase MutT (NUDIX family)